jgi:NAD(P)-dependent dehydrogenase (short-subunit alcohol dehydrogenase family)
MQWGGARREALPDRSRVPIEATERRFGRLDVMVANAGIGILSKAIEMCLADWRRQTAVNLDGVFLSVKYAVPAWLHDWPMTVTPRLGSYPVCQADRNIVRSRRPNAAPSWESPCRG